MALRNVRSDMDEQLRDVQSAAMSAVNRAAGLETAVSALTRELGKERERSGMIASSLGRMVQRLDVLELNAARLSGGRGAADGGTQDADDPAIALALRVKMEVASLREALLGRLDDRSHFVLEFEKLRQHCELLAKQGNEQKRLTDALTERLLMLEQRATAQASQS